MSFFYEDDEDDMYDYIPGEYVYGDDMYVPDEYMGEKWWYIDSAPGYMASDRGRVWSEKTQKFLKGCADHGGHIYVDLRVNGHTQREFIHRLIAKAFVPNPDGLPLVRHLDDCPDNNYKNNLKWGTKRDNYMDSVANGIAYKFTKDDYEKAFKKTRKPVIAVELHTNNELFFNSLSECAKVIGGRYQEISKCLHGKRDTYKGYLYRYAEVE